MSRRSLRSRSQREVTMIAKELRVARTVMFVALLTTIFGGSIGCGMTNGQSNQDTGIPSLQVLNEVASEVNKS